MSMVYADRIMATQKTCPHGSSFHCQPIYDSHGETLQYVYACSLACGFHMNFDPGYAGRRRDHVTPKDEKLDEWKLCTLAFVDRGG